ncbi:MAG: alpha-ketoglutarate-dependent dioxygenase AlkB [Flavobacteriia bacterium]|nr:alpha-ketoglutarate-dependent dioxygenase AlkB [Flavobacteriia bacterium]OIP47249.1 MAG: alpha-ketoglutarate-dependent dioxygenase AlkB [Flavobacteriaceae bacterium CG2_30_31_66]PIV95986.1 MAG: alpha-ketoglutarate-dependent dioxygenase AlkB [Flavobacteriaceae bacterium CG17_big_fil_post_rev_8_21_14_2_50_31_13]PIY14072.1 MAG: alpha-ketoglutarate-dependent dioxygenase AlkB [Flavobacteriaceae bacterium CG_4_10_14_3_um_filter_31_253]PIZ09545.1 MAG: alpha-ketoglutarate-dependent dioxygenase AlkB 
MDLFSTEKVNNILPFDGITNNYGVILSKIDADFYYKNFLETIHWEHDQAIIFGKIITTKRKVAWFGDENFNYTYSKITKKANIWTDELLALKQIVEKESNETYNSCLLNLYHSGEEGMAYHSDGEKMLRKNGAIASVSLGATRKFSFKHKSTHHKVDVILEHGSLLVMKGETQTHWLHRLPTTKKVTSPRINLTFRTIER